MRFLKIIQAVKAGRPPALGDVPGPLLNSLASLCRARGRVMELSSLERVLTAVSHKEPDRVPVTPLVNAAARSINGVGFPEYSTNPYSAADVLVSGYELLGGDFLVLLMDLSVEAEGWGQKVIYPLNSTARPDYDLPLVKSMDDYARIKPILWSDGKRMRNFVKMCELVVRRIGFRALVAGFVFGPLGVLSMMRGAEKLFKDVILYPKKVMPALEAITETLVGFTQAQIDAGVSGVAIDSLYASQSSLPKDVWERVEGPFCREIANVCKKNRVVTGIHNCGHGVYFDAQIRSMEPDAISFAQLPDDCSTAAEMKERYGDRITFIGYVPTPLLVHGTPAQVMEEARRQIDVLARDGGFILAPGCEYPPNLELTNALALVRAAERYG